MSNSLYGKTANWVGDRSEGGTTLAVDGSSVTIASATKGSPFNVYNHVEGGLSGAYYFEGTVTELNGNISFGLVAKDEVRPGYKTRGMFYNGNLTNGAAAKTTAFGEYLKQGSKVGVLCIPRSDSIKVYFDVNGNCLGLAFEVSNPSHKTYYPCLHVTGSAKIDVAVPAQLPICRERSTPQSDDPYQGQWKLVKAFYGPELGQFPLPDNHKIVATFDKQDASSYNLSIKVANNMRSKVTLTGNKLEGGFDEVSIGLGMSTMMLGPPELQKVENELIGKGLPVVTKMIVTTSSKADGKTLLLQGATVGMEFELYVATFAPVTSYQ